MIAAQLTEGTSEEEDGDSNVDVGIVVVKKYMK